MIIKILMLVLILISIILILLYSKCLESFKIVFDPKSTALNPMGNIAQIMYNLQTPRDCEKAKNNVYNNPFPTEEDVNNLYNCVNNPYDRYLIKSLPFGAKGGT
jgi:hypothetical protein